MSSNPRRQHSWQPGSADEPSPTLTRLTKAAREVGFDPADYDDLAPARGIVWAALAMLCVFAALALLLLPA